MMPRGKSENEVDLGEYVECKRSRICRMKCRSDCNTHIPLKKEEVELIQKRGVSLARARLILKKREG